MRIFIIPFLIANGVNRVATECYPGQYYLDYDDCVEYGDGTNSEVTEVLF